jgi:hypothetical protein
MSSDHVNKVREAIQADKILNDAGHVRRPHVARAIEGVKSVRTRRRLALAAAQELWGLDLGEKL